MKLENSMHITLDIPQNFCSNLILKQNLPSKGIVSILNFAFRTVVFETQNLEISRNNKNLIFDL